MGHLLIALAACRDPAAEPIATAAPTVATLATPATSPTSTPEPVDTRGDALFDPSYVHEVSLWIDATAWEALTVDPEGWVQVDLEVDGVELPGVGARLKGGGSFEPIDQKPCWKFETDRFTDDLELDGLDELALNNMRMDPSMLHERTAYEAYRALGIPAPRAAHARVTVNLDDYGLYTLVEAQDGRFLDRWYDDDSGPLFEMNDVDFVPADVRKFDHDGGPDDRRALRGIADALVDPGATLTGAAAEWLDVGSFVRYFAASAVIGQFDAYPYSFPGDDVVLYVDPADDHVDFLPHGADETFGVPDRPVDYVFGLLAERCLADPECAWQWSQEVWSAVDAIEASDLSSYVETVAGQIREPALADPRKPYTAEEVDAGQQAVLDWLAGRREALEWMPGLRP